MASTPLSPPLAGAITEPDRGGIVVDLCEAATFAPTLDELHDCWGSSSRARLGLSRRQWHHPATLDLVDAITQGLDLTESLRAVGEARASAGLSLDETLADLSVLAELVPSSATASARNPDEALCRVDTWRAASVVGTAWAESFYGGVLAPACVDPLTGLVTGSYLEARLAQLYRQAAATGRRPHEGHVLVVVEVRGRDLSPFASIAQRIRSAGAVRAAFPNADTLAVLEPTGAMVVLAANDESLANDVAAVQATVRHAAVWVEKLPAGCDAALSLTREVASIPRRATIAHRGYVRHP